MIEDRVHPIEIGWILLGAVLLAGCRGVLEVQIERMPFDPRASLGQVAYISGGDVWLLDLDSGDQIRLTRDGYNRRPRVSPDGDRVAYSMLIDFCTGDMQRRGCTPDSIETNRRALNRFGRSLAPNWEALKLRGITSKKTKEYVTSLQGRKEKWIDHPYRPPENSALSPFTIRKEVKSLRGFGTWLERQGYANPFSDLEIPKVPKLMLEVLTDEGIERVLDKIIPSSRPRWPRSRQGSQEVSPKAASEVQPAYGRSRLFP